MSLLVPEVLQRIELVLAGIGRLGSRMQDEPRRGVAGGFLLGAGLGWSGRRALGRSWPP